MTNFMLNYLNEKSGTDIQNLQVFNFTTGGLIRRFNGDTLEFLRTTVTYGDEWVEDNTKYNALLDARIAKNK